MPFIVILGEEEKKNGGVKIKDVAGRQEVVYLPLLSVSVYPLTLFWLSQDFVKMEDLVPELQRRLSNLKEKPQVPSGIEVKPPS